ncbi:MAG: hypothetical protein ACRC1M_04955, partial [Methanobacteriaceae archaeon]
MTTIEAKRNDEVSNDNKTGNNSVSVEILYKLAKKDISITPRAYMKVKSLEDPISFVSSLIIKIKSQSHNKADNIEISRNNRKNRNVGNPLLIADEELVVNLIKEEGLELINNSQTASETDSNNNINSSTNTNSIIPNKTNTSNPNNNTTNTTNSSYNNDNTNNSNTNNSNANNSDNSNSNIINSNTSNSSTNNDNAINSNTNNTDNNDITVCPEPNGDNISNIEVERVEGLENISPEIKNKFKRNEAIDSDVSFDGFEIIQDTSQQSYTSGEIGNLVTYFQ